MHGILRVQRAKTETGSETKRNASSAPQCPLQEKNDNGQASTGEGLGMHWDSIKLL